MYYSHSNVGTGIAINTGSKNGRRKMNQFNQQYELENTSEDEWSPSMAASRSSVFALGIGVGLILATTPVLAQGVGSGPNASAALHLEAVQLVGFLAILACMPAVLLVCASFVRILLVITKMGTGTRRETISSPVERTWKRTDTNPALPAPHLALPVRLSVDMDCDDRAPQTSWGTLSETSFPRFPAV
jgi:hypothetical protein